jgi:hypothetical protein
MLHLPLDDFLASQELILKENSEREGLLIFEYPFPGFFSLLASSSSKGWITVYDIVDDWQDFHRVGQAPWFDYEFEKYMVNAVDLVVAANQQLAEKARGLGAEDVLIVPNGYRAGIGEVRSPIQLSRGNVTLGYFGHLTSAWFDWDLVRKIAEAKLEWVIHLIGEVDQAGPPSLSENIIYHPRMPQLDLAAYAQNWDVGIIPFKDIHLARAADPIKAYEYSAMRLPVVMTGPYPPIGAGEWMRRAENVETFISAVENLCGLDFRTTDVDQFLAQSTWSMRVDQLLDAIHRGDQGIAWKRALFG